MTVGLGVGVGLVFAANCGGTCSKHCLNMKVICINFMHAGRGVFGGYAGYTWAVVSSVVKTYVGAWGWPNCGCCLVRPERAKRQDLCTMLGLHQSLNFMHNG